MNDNVLVIGDELIVGFKAVCGAFIKGMLVEREFLVGCGVGYCGGENIYIAHNSLNQ